MHRWTVSALVGGVLLIAQPAFAEDAVSLMRPVTVAHGEVLEGDVIALVGGARIEGQVEGDVISAFGHIEVGPTGQIDGDAVTGLGQLRLEGAVGGRSVSLQRSEVGLLGRLLRAFFRSFSLAAIGFGLVSVWPEPTRRLRRMIETRAAGSFAVGAMVGGGLLLGATVMAIVPLGRPLAGLTLAGGALGGVAGLAIAAEAIGARARRAAPRPVALGAGAAILLVLQLVPWLGPLAILGLTCLGLGAGTLLLAAGQR